MNTRYTATVLSLAAMLAASAAHAGEGVLEINQQCATNGGCFAGDSGGFPVTISETGNPRSYVLTSDLVLPADTDGVDISVANVSLDLNGFEIRGPESCTGTPVTSCSGSGSQRGVRAFADGTRVHNGSVSGVGGTGIRLEGRGRVSEVVVSESGGPGINVSRDAEIRNATARRNGDNGIMATSGATIDGCRSSGNGATGIFIFTGPSSVVTGSTARNNGVYGIFVESGGVIRDSASGGNGDHGVVLSGSTTADTTSINNAGLGILCGGGAESALKGVILTGNNGGANQYNSNCVELGANLCEGNTTCP